MLEQLLQLLAMALDTLPTLGRVMLLAVLLAVTLYALCTRLPQGLGSSINILYRKGALVSLLAIPWLVYLLGVQMPVYMDEVTRFHTELPGQVVVALGVVWVVGFAVALVRLSLRIRNTRLALVELLDRGQQSSKLTKRAEHWCRRVNCPNNVSIVCVGSDHAWHGVNGFVVLPAAAANWPTGVVDVMLLQQIAQLKQGAMRWRFYGAVVSCVYWPLVWVSRLAHQLSEHMAAGGGSLARSAYRDPEGWRRDVRNLANRTDTLQDLPVIDEDSLVRLPQVAWAEVEMREVGPSTPDDPTFEHKWALTKERRAERHRDPYEQAYWLIAAACIVVGIATTLTLVQTPPEFERNFLQVKWQDQMGRRMHETDDAGERVEP